MRGRMQRGLRRAVALLLAAVAAGMLFFVGGIQAGAQEGAVRLPVLMYHSVLKSPSRQGKYTVTPAQFESDLQYLRAQGYETVVIQDLIDFADAGKPLPEKPILLTFDDGHFNNVYYAEPLLQQYGMRAVIFVVGAFSDQSTAEGEQNPNYSYVSWEELSAMAERGVWDIQSHTWNMHGADNRHGVRKKRGETAEAYEAALRQDIETITARLTEATGTRPRAFAYPFGAPSETADRLLREQGYRVTFSCVDKPAALNARDPEGLYDVCRLLRAGNRSLAKLLG